MSEMAFDALPVLSEWERQCPSEAIERRRNDAVQPCMFCAKPALFCYIAHTLEPPRWVDVCGPHSRYLRDPSHATLDGIAG